MHNQVKVQLYRLKTTVSFYAIGAAFLAFSVLYIYTAFQKGIYLDGMDFFLDSISDTSLIFPLTLFVSYFVGADFSNRTIQNEIRIGYSRLSVIWSRWIVSLVSSTLLYPLFYSLPVLIMSGIKNGFGDGIWPFDLLTRIILFFLQMVAIQSFTLLIVFLCKNSNLGIIASVGFTFLTCNILRNFFSGDDSLFAITSFYRIMMNYGVLSAQDILISLASAIINILGVFFYNLPNI